MQPEKLNIAVFVDYDNIELGLRSTLQRQFDVALPLNALKERGDLVAKFAYANWGRQEFATRQMAESAVQMVQRVPSPRGDKNGADINLALDALEMAFTHDHVNAFAIVSGDSDFIPLVNKLKEYGKTVFVVGGKGFTSTILQQNCHEFISYESLLDDTKPQPVIQQREFRDRGPRDRDNRGDIKDRPRDDRGPRQRPAPLDISQALPLVERALQVLERRAVQPQLGLLKSTMLQLDPAFSEKAYGCGSFSEFVDKLKRADFVNVTGTGGRTLIERKGSSKPEISAPKPEEAIPALRDILEIHRIEMEEGTAPENLYNWMREENSQFDLQKYGFQEFTEFLNFAQDKLVVRLDADEEKGLTVFLGAEFYPPAPPPKQEQEIFSEYDEKQPIVAGQPTIFEPDPPQPPPPPPAKRPRAPRKRTAAAGNSDRPPRQPRRTPARKKPPNDS
ncbi:MAG TPA: NYN domain-containing protein [Bryobacteraceae bacterium]|nr:NYN domain-containing protein [Bryobacteraceae bacterium]